MSIYLQRWRNFYLHSLHVYKSCRARNPVQEELTLYNKMATCRHTETKQGFLDLAKVLHSDLQMAVSLSFI